MALIYLSHPIGDGGTLSETEKHANKQRAFRFVNRLREMFPHIKFFCPAEAEIFVSKVLEGKSDCCNAKVRNITMRMPTDYGKDAQEFPSNVCTKCSKECTTHQFMELDEVLDVDCEIIRECEGLIAYTPNGKISKGMDIEIEFANKNNIPVLNLWYSDDINESKLKELVEIFIIDAIDG